MPEQHHCHAFDCKKQVPPKLLMCLKHWKMVPRQIQAAVWNHYRKGQEIDKRPSKEYALVQRAAVWCVWVSEGRGGWPDIPEVGTKEYMTGPAGLRPPLFQKL